MVSAAIRVLERVDLVATRVIVQVDLAVIQDYQVLVAIVVFQVLVAILELVALVATQDIQDYQVAQEVQVQMDLLV